MDAGPAGVGVLGVGVRGIRVLGIVPVRTGDRRAPAGSAALRRLNGVPLLARALETLLLSGVVDEIVVACPQSLSDALSELAAGLPAARQPGAASVRVSSAPGSGTGLPFALAGTDADLVVIHDPLHALAPPELVRLVVEALRDAGPQVAAAVPVRPVTDTLKWVAADDLVGETADREEFRMVYSPQAHRTSALRAALAAASPDDLLDGRPDVLPRLAQALGGRLVSVPAPSQVFRIADQEDLLFAEAALHVAARQPASARVSP